MSSILRSFLPTVSKRHAERRILRETCPEQLFDIIVDVNRYKEFVPLCTKSDVLTSRDSSSSLSTSQEGQEEYQLDALLEIGIGGGKQSALPSFSSPLTEEYVSRVTVDRRNLCVETCSVDGSTRNDLFDSIKSSWKLRGINDENTFRTGVASTGVEFEVEIKVSNPVIAGILDTVLKDVAGLQVEAFQQRYLEIHAK